jgi:hypothetical protein
MTLNCGCECNSGGFCGGCGHAGCSGGINLRSTRDEFPEPVTFITFEVRCLGCEQLVTPGEVDWGLFRLGLNVHDKETCKDKLEGKLRREEVRPH